MSTDPIDAKLKEELREIESCYPLRIQVDTVTERSLNGTEAAVTVVAFVLGGITSGLLSSLGQDVWTRIKQVCAELRRQRSPAQMPNGQPTPASQSVRSRPAPARLIIRFEIVVLSEQANVQLLCHLKPGEDTRKLDLFARALPKKLKAVEGAYPAESRQGDVRSERVFEFKADETWERKR